MIVKLEFLQVAEICELIIISLRASLSRTARGIPIPIPASVMSCSADSDWSKGPEASLSAMWKAKSRESRSRKEHYR